MLHGRTLNVQDQRGERLHLYSFTPFNTELCELLTY